MASLLNTPMPKTGSRRLTGAAKRSHETRVLIECARLRLTQRDAHSVGDTCALLRTAVG